VHTGWTQNGTGWLVLQDAGSGVRNINRVLGAENNSGFAALGQCPIVLAEIYVRKSVFRDEAANGFSASLGTLARGDIRWPPP
jgi:hypothetical protein